MTQHPLCPPFPLEQALFQALEAKSALDLQWIDLQGRFPLASYFLLATATSSRHMETLYTAAKEICRAHNIAPHVDGRHKEDLSSWIVLDAHNTFVHIFTPETRATYDLERLWQELLSQPSGVLPSREQICALDYV